MSDADELVTFRYEGHFDGINVRLPNGKWFSAQPGSTVRMNRDEAKVFRQAEGWVQERAKTSASKVED